MPLGTIDKDAMTINIRDVLSGEVEMSSMFEDTVSFLKSLCEVYSTETVIQHLHYENFTTPYLHNINSEMFIRYLTETLGLLGKDGFAHGHEVSITLTVPPGGIGIHKTFPHPEEYSTEDINLGDDLIKNQK